MNPGYWATGYLSYLSHFRPIELGCNLINQVRHGVVVSQWEIVLL